MQKLQWQCCHQPIISINSSLAPKLKNSADEGRKGGGENYRGSRGSARVRQFSSRHLQPVPIRYSRDPNRHGKQQNRYVQFRSVQEASFSSSSNPALFLLPLLRILSRPYNFRNSRTVCTLSLHRTGPLGSDSS